MFDNFYGLTGKPFQLTPDPDFYFRSATHRKALSYLGYGLAQGEGFVVITGEVGAGKSTLVAHMVDNIDPAQMTVAQVVTSKLDGDEIVHVIARSFGLDIAGHDKASALGAIEGFLHEEAREGRRCLLVVDESQNLSVQALEELRMLSNFQLGHHPLLQILLLGQPEFRETIQLHPELEQLRQRVIAAHHLEPMQRSEIEPYLTHRLQKVGWEGNPAFDQRVYAGLYEASGGIPRKINQIANRLLLLGAVEERARIDSVLLKAVLEEMEGERAFPKAAPKAVGAPAPASPEPAAQDAAPDEAAPAPEADPPLDRETFDMLLAERDAQIAELQQAVIELDSRKSGSTDAPGDPDAADLREQVAALEARLAEQESTLRHTLTMLIEWIEDGSGRSRAA